MSKSETSSDLSSSSPSESSPFWLMIGASAGGLEALNEFLPKFRAYSNCYTIIAQHLDPKHPTILKDLLARVTDIPVELVTEEVTPQTNRIYIIGPGFNARIEGNRIKLSPADAIGPQTIH